MIRHIACRGARQGHGIESDTVIQGGLDGLPVADIVTWGCGFAVGKNHQHPRGDGMSGGGTKLFAIDHTFIPRKGQAVIWNNLNTDGTPNPATQHSGEPVTAGHKIIITKWFRELGSGPMFYES